jgi:hypothetical protein
MSRSLVAVGLGIALAGCGPGGGDTGNEAHTSCADLEVRSERDLHAAAECEVISGFLRVEGQSWVQAVELPSLKRVEGELILSGLEAITAVVLPALESTEILRVVEAPVLTELNLEALRSAGDVELTGNGTLETLSLPALQDHVGDDLILLVWNNERLERVSMPALTAFVYDGTDTGDSFRIELELYDNPALDTLDLPQLEQANRLGLGGNSSLASLEGLGSLQALGSLSVYDCDALRSFEGLASLRTIFSLTLAENENLEGLSGLEEVDSVRQVWLTDNPSFASLAALGADAETLDVGSGGVWIENNPSLDDLGLLSGLASTTDSNGLSWGGVGIVSTPGLVDLTDLASLVSVEQDLVIAHNENLTSLTGLDALESIGDAVDDFNHTYYYGGLSIEDDDALTDLTGLESLEVVYGYLEIVDNASLTSLHGLDNLTGVYGGELSISGNPMLCQEDAEAFAASIEAWHGVTVENNGTGRTDCGS